MADCQAPIQQLKAIREWRKDLDQSEPGWTEVTYFCPWCGEEHVLVSGEKQVPMLLGLNERHTSRRSRLPSVPAQAGENYCRWHRTSSPELRAPCAYCGTEIHVHRDALGRVKSGRAEKGYLVEKCPPGHHENAVMPAKKGIRTARLENGAPVLQMSLVG